MKPLFSIAIFVTWLVMLVVLLIALTTPSVYGDYSEVVTEKVMTYGLVGIVCLLLLDTIFEIVFDGNCRRAKPPN